VIFEKNKVIRNAIELTMDNKEVVFASDFSHVIKLLNKKKPMFL